MFLLGLEIVAFGGGSIACSYLWALIVQDIAEEEVNKWLSDASEENRGLALVLKSEFQGAEVKQHRAVENHTHGASAAVRSSASFFIQRVAQGVGKEPYFFQGSGANSRAGVSYSRNYHWAKDLMAPAAVFEPDPSNIISIVDVDYYIDMEEMLVDRFQPYMLYTLVPSRAAKDAGDYGYCFDSHGKVQYHVSGGGGYSHELWDWDGDSIRVFKRVCGFAVAMACYSLERRQFDADHQVILLVPLFRTTNPFAVWLTRDRLAAKTLTRFNPVSGKFVRFYATKTDGRCVVTGKVGEYTSCCIPARIDSAIASAGAVLTGKLTLATVKSKMDDGRTNDIKNHEGAEVLMEFHKQRLPTYSHVSLVDSVRRFQWVPKGAEPDAEAKPGMSAFMRPLLDGGFVPDSSLGNEQRFVDKRMIEIASKELPIDPFMLKTMNEFAKFLIPDGMKHRLVPVEVEEVYERQSKPSQRAILLEAEHGRSVRLTKQFMKREAYQSVTDPRGISTINGVDKRDFSTFVYAFTDSIMKDQEWYAFGKSPVEVAQRVATIASGAVTLSMTDFSRMDGRNSNVLSFFEKLVMLRAFNGAYHVELAELLNKHHHLAARTVFGIKFNTEFQTLSGGAATSVGNTLKTAYIAYHTYRMMFVDPAPAWRKLGIFGGDDGVSPDMNPVVAKKAAARVGQVLDLAEVERGDMGVAFLARRYGPDVWYGDTVTCCDIKRQLAKFHLTVNLPSNIPPALKLQEKAFAFSLTDAETPILGEFVSKVLDLYPTSASEFRNELRIWGVEMDAGNQYPNEYREWMHDLVAAELPNFDLDRFREWISNATDRTIFDPPRFAESLPPNPKPGLVTIDGDLVISVDDNTGKGSATSRDKDSADGTANFRPRKPKDERLAHKVTGFPTKRGKKPKGSLKGNATSNRERKEAHAN